MEPSTPALPQLSSYLPSSPDTCSPSRANTDIIYFNGMGAKKQRNSIEGAFSAISPERSSVHQPKDEHQHRRKQAPLEDSDVDGSDKVASLPRLSYTSHPQEQADPLFILKSLSSSSTTSSQDDDKTDVETNRSVASAHQTTPRRERTSRYLSEGDRREIITRIDRGEKQVTLAKEFGVSRAAICNLYKNRWEVLSRGNCHNPESKHPKKSGGKRLSPQSTPQYALIDDAVPDVSAIAINTDEMPGDIGENFIRAEEFAPCRPSHDYRTSNTPFAIQDGASQPTVTDISHNHESSFGLKDRPSGVSSSPFLVHEASTFSYPCRNLIAALRDETISSTVFENRVKRLVRLLIEEAFTCLPHENIKIKNQFGDISYIAQPLDELDICGISMEENGLLLRAFSTISPTSYTGVISATSSSAGDKISGNIWSSAIHAQLPPVNLRQVVLLLDIECATGKKACTVLYHLVHEKQIHPKRIYFVTIISSFEGLQTVFRHFPDVTLISAQVDTVLDGNQHIRPGLGDFTRRYQNVNVRKPYL